MAERAGVDQEGAAVKVDARVAARAQAVGAGAAHAHDAGEGDRAQLALGPDEGVGVDVDVGEGDARVAARTSAQSAGVCWGTFTEDSRQRWHFLSSKPPYSTPPLASMAMRLPGTMKAETESG